jgi:hypothetical protein
MRRKLDGTPLDSNRIYIFRYPVTLHADQALSGRLLCAGDIVNDTYGRDEIIVADGPTVTILQLNEYGSDPMFEDPPRLFRTVGRYALDAAVTSAAIADVDGDGNNDLLVVTESGTYLIGRPHPLPLGIVGASRPELCSGDTISFRWQRAVAGGEGGVRVELESLDSGTRRIVDTAMGERYTLDGEGLEPGRYRLHFVDNDVASVTAASPEFVVQRAVISPFSVPAATRVGDVLELSTDVSCADRVVLEFSYETGVWVPVGTPIPVIGDVATALFTVRCPTGIDCDTGAARPIRFRFRTLDSSVISSPEVSLVSVPVRSVEAAPVAGSPRRRTLVWSPTELDCDSARISLSTDNGATWEESGIVDARTGRTDVEVLGELSQEVLARVCCVDDCGVGLARFVVSEISDANFIAPNPFNPSGASESDAVIIYRLETSGTVSITIYDASRAVVRPVVVNEPLGAGLHRASWDGRNGEGEIVADGTYICVIASSTGERLLLPLSIAKR